MSSRSLCMPSIEVEFMLESADLDDARRQTKLTQFSHRGKTDSRIGRWRFGLQAQSMSIASPTDEREWPWKLIHRVEQYSHGALIEIPQRHLWLPARAFKSRSDFERFVSRMIS